MNYRAVVIGSTGQGNYGHDLDVVFNDRPNITVAALADPDPAGRAAAARRCHAQRTYADYEEMLDKEKPDLVSVGPRWTDRHFAMVMACLRHGAHVYCEKPFMPTLAEGDEVVALAARKNLKICVAHQSRVAPGTLFLKRRIEEGMIGELLELRMHAKDDSRIGGEIMLDLGPHIFDLARFFAGAPQWCSARIAQDGREVTAADIHPASEKIGPVVGNQIEAFISYPGGRVGRFSSRAHLNATAGPYGMELIGSRGAVFVEIGTPMLLTSTARNGGAHGKAVEWRRLPGDPTPLKGRASERFGANWRLVDDWLDAIEHDREPASSGRTAMLAVEVIHGIFAAGMNRGRVDFPLQNRRHPLAT